MTGTETVYAPVAKMSRGYRAGFVLSGTLLALAGLTLVGAVPFAAEGKALKPNVVGVWDWDQPLAPGEEWVLMSAFMHNIGDDAITLRKIEIVDSEGLGKSVVVTSIEVAPLPGLHGDSGPDRPDDATPGGLFKTYPPTATFPLEKSVCETQKLAAVKGYVLVPRAEARVLVRLEAIEDGDFDLDGVRVFYDANGRSYSQILSIGMEGVVSSTKGRPLAIARDEKSCATESQILPSGTRS